MNYYKIENIKSTLYIYNMSSKKVGYRTKKAFEIYSKAILTRRITIQMKYVGSTLKSVLEELLKKENEGKCVEEGFIRKDSIKIIKYSCGTLVADNVEFHVVFECFVCRPVEGMIINCIAKNITKAGIKAETDDEISPVVIFISRDHHYQDKYFSEVTENDEIMVRVIGQRYELFDPYISVIAELQPKKAKKKPKLILKSN